MAVHSKTDYENYSAMVGIYVDSNDNIESAIKRFKKDCERSGIMSEMKKRQYFEKPSIIRKRKLDSVKRKRMKKLKRFNNMM